MRSRLGFAKALAFVAGPSLLAFGCGDLGPGAKDLRDLERNEARWRATGPTSYVYAMGWSCFCPTEYLGPVRITVEDGAAVTRVYVETGAAVPDNMAANFPTVDGLFDRLRAAIQSGPYELDVTYDPDLGTPLEYWIDHERNVADDEVGMSVTELVTPIP